MPNLVRALQDAYQKQTYRVSEKFMRDPEKKFQGRNLMWRLGNHAACINEQSYKTLSVGAKSI